MQNMHMAAPQQPQDLTKVFQSEKEFLELATYDSSIMATVEERILKKYGVFVGTSKKTL